MPGMPYFLKFFIVNPTSLKWALPTTQLKVSEQ